MVLVVDMVVVGLHEEEVDLHEVLVEVVVVDEVHLEVHLEVVIVLTENFDVIPHINHIDLR